VRFEHVLFVDYLGDELGGTYGMHGRSNKCVSNCDEETSEGEARLEI
jgi:hypothetical protein